MKSNASILIHTVFQKLIEPTKIRRLKYKLKSNQTIYKHSLHVLNRNEMRIERIMIQTEMMHTKMTAGGKAKAERVREIMRA